MINDIQEILADKELFINRYDRITRKNGKTKVRKIVAPIGKYLDILTKISNILYDNYGDFVSDYSYAWRKSCSRSDCAQKHVGKKYVIEMDIKDFFGNITKEHLVRYFQLVGIDHIINEINISFEDFMSFITLNDILPQGYPTSPLLANLVRFDIDIAISQNIPQGITYTAYGDNLIFSTDNHVDYKELVNTISNIVEHYGFILNKSKTKFMPFYRRQEVLGIVVNKKISISDDYFNKVIKELLSAIRNAQSPSDSLIGKIENIRLANNQKNYNYLKNLIRRAYNVGSEQPAI